MKVVKDVARTDTPQEIVDLLMARTLSLKEEFDDATCGALVRGTMDAELFDDPSPRGRLSVGWPTIGAASRCF